MSEAFQKMNNTNPHKEGSGRIENLLKTVIVVVAFFVCEERVPDDNEHHHSKREDVGVCPDDDGIAAQGIDLLEVLEEEIETAQEQHELEGIVVDVKHTLCKFVELRIAFSNNRETLQNNQVKKVIEDEGEIRKENALDDVTLGNRPHEINVSANCLLLEDIEAFSCGETFHKLNLVVVCSSAWLSL